MEEDYDLVLNKLGISKKEFSDLMAAPPKSYRDYPNNELIFRAYGLFIRTCDHILRRFEGAFPKS
jgi:hypothetical protein